MEHVGDDLGSMLEDVRRLADERTKHEAECKLGTCVRCERAPCPACKAPSSISRFGGDAELCQACSVKRAMRRRAAPALASIPETFSAVTLDAPWLAKLVGSAAMADARAVDRHGSLVLVGPPGSGKTSLAIAMFRAVVEVAARQAGAEVFSRRPDVLSHRVCSAHAIAKARAFHPLGEGEAPAVKAALDADLLLLDELGGEDARYASAVTEVIYERHAQMRPTWITTGVHPKAIAARYGGGIARRVFEDAKVFQLGKR